MAKIGDRVGAILKADKETVHLLGYGTFEGHHIPESGSLHEMGIANPKIKLDNGSVVWGYQCWWGAEERVKVNIGSREVVPATVA